MKLVVLVIKSFVFASLCMLLAWTASGEMILAKK